MGPFNCRTRSYNSQLSITPEYIGAEELNYATLEKKIYPAHPWTSPISFSYISSLFNGNSHLYSMHRRHSVKLQRLSTLTSTSNARSTTRWRMRCSSRRL